MSTVKFTKVAFALKLNIALASDYANPFIFYCFHTPSSPPPPPPLRVAYASPFIYFLLFSNTSLHPTPLIAYDSPLLLIFYCFQIPSSPPPSSNF